MVVVRRYIDRIMCNKMLVYDVEFAMRFESALSVPTFFKFLHFVTSVLIAYDGPGGAWPISGDSIV